MKKLDDLKENIHKCSKCGLCQAECPIYKVTGNDCTVSRGIFIMLRGYLKGELKLSRTIKRYLDICMKCGKCSTYCPSGIDAVEIITAAKSEYFKKSFFEKVVSGFQKNILFGFVPDFFGVFKKPFKSQKFDKKVLYFGGCGSKFKGDKSVVKLMNKLGIEVVNPSFKCCGVSLFVRGDFSGYIQAAKEYIKILKKHNVNEVITTCASCEKSLKEYVKYLDKEEDKAFLSNIRVKNVYEYIREKGLKITLKTPQCVTYHKPCHLKNYDDIEWVLNNTEALEYVKMNDFDECCGLNGLSNIKEYKVFSNIFRNKQRNIIKTNCKKVLTSCLGCEVALKAYSFNKYKVYDLLDFLAKYL